MSQSPREAILLFLTTFLLALGSVPVQGANDPATQASLNDGYSLFYDFCNQESQLSLLLWIKHTPPDIADYANRISATAKDDMAILKQFSVNNAALRLDKISLPSFELDVRKSMGDDRKQQLIWGSSGAAFAQAMAMTQSEVTNYGLHVAKVLADTDPNADRARAMQKIFEKWSALHQEAYHLTR
jgi:hypothetical protein